MPNGAAGEVSASNRMMIALPTLSLELLARAVLSVLFLKPA